MEKTTNAPGYFLKIEWGLVFDKLSNAEIG